jgi:phage baseplate assembly protein gpV
MNGMNTPLGKQVSVLCLALAFSFATGLCASTQNTLGAPAAPSGAASFLFTNATALVYDLTGRYQFGHEVVVAGGRKVMVSLGLSVQQDAAGVLRGSGVTNIQVGNELVAASYSISGRVTGGGGNATRATLSVRWLSSGVAVGTNGSFTISVQYNLGVSPGGLSGTATGQARFAKLGNGTIKSTLSAVPLPAGVNGHWSVNMNLQPPGGTGSVILPNGRSLPASLAGSFSARSGLELIKLSGVGSDPGSALTINFFPATGAVDSLSGKMLGQSVTIKSLSAKIPSPTVSPASPSPAPSAYAVAQICQECHTPIQQTLNNTRHPQVGVTCQNCHGSLANHAANPYDPAARPVVDDNVLSTACGACHVGPQHEWKTSAHASVSVSCPTCHEPHMPTGFSDQLRAPLFSTNNYSTTTTQVFPTSNNPRVNLCAQCHNDHGASWRTTSAPPRSTPQYNIMLGTVGELASGLPHSDPSYHALHITNQCVGCHMQATPYRGPTQPAMTGHQFTVNSYDVCTGCHGSAVNASNFVVFVSMVITSQIKEVQDSLNLWATTKAPSVLTAKYGKRSWEYTTPGALSPGGSGPNAAGQALIPDNIKKARFNLYLVLYDGSFGVHNGPYDIDLLDAAQNWVNQELSQ